MNDRHSPPCLYEAFGFGLLSEIPIPELQEGDAQTRPLIRVTTTKLDPVSEPHRSPDGGWSWVDGSRAYIGWEGVGTFRVGQRHIAVDPEADCPPERVRIFLLGAAMGVTLHLNGLLVLHGSAVVHDGGAVAFLGPKWSGKSTMAASLVARGHDLITDDVVAIEPGAAEPLVRPGFSQLKLWPDSLEAIGQDGSAFPKLHPDFEKREIRVADRFVGAPVPLRAVVFLAKADQVELEELDSVASIEKLISHWYCARFGYEMLADLGLSAQFLLTTRLAENVRCCRLGRPASLAAISEVAETVEALL